MKLLHATLSLAMARQAHAGFALIEQTIQDTLSARERESNGTRPSLRQFSALTASAVAGIRDGWGCWCYFDDDSYQGRGNPLNDGDAACKVLQQGYECFEMDAGGTCMDPWDVPYVSVNLATVINEDYTAACEAANGNNNCAKRACTIESRFSDRILRYFDAINGNYDTSMMHTSGSWDSHTSCPIKVSANSGVQHKECCGTYPLRFPYKQTGDRACCEGVTYDKGLFQCCPDGNIELVCS